MYTGTGQPNPPKQRESKLNSEANWNMNSAGDVAAMVVTPWLQASVSNKWKLVVDFSTQRIPVAERRAIISACADRPNLWKRK